MMNAMDFLPIDVMAWVYENVFGQEHWRAVPTSDINTTFALALSVWFLMIFFTIKVKGWAAGYMSCFARRLVLTR